MIITKDTDVNRIPLEELAAADINTWIALRQYHPERYAELEAHALGDKRGADPKYQEAIRKEAERQRAADKWKKTTAAQYENMGLTERTRMKREAPEVYDKLTNEAKAHRAERNF